MGCPFLLQEIFPTQGLNPGLPHCRQTLYRLSHQGEGLFDVIFVFAMTFLVNMLFSRQGVCSSLRPHGQQHSGPVTDSRSSLKPMSITSVRPSNHLVLCRPLLLPPSTFPSLRVFSSESALLIRWPKRWSFSFSISPSNKYSGLIFRMDWFDFLQFKGLESSPTSQFKSINSSALSFLYSPTLISIHDYRKNCSFDETDLCWQSDVSALIYCRE